MYILVCNPPTSLARRVRVLLHFSYLISHISYWHSHNLLLSYLVSHIWGGVWGGDCRPHHQLVLNPALSSYAILTILTLLYYTYGIYTTCSRAHTNAYLKLSGAVWSCLELSRAIWSYLELSGAIWSYLKSYGAIWSYLEPLELSGAIYLEQLDEPA